MVYQCVGPGSGLPVAVGTAAGVPLEPALGVAAGLPPDVVAIPVGDMLGAADGEAVDVTPVIATLVMSVHSIGRKSSVGAPFATI